MIPALINLIIVLIVAAVLYWALGKLWPLTGAFGSSAIGQVIYVILIVIGVLYVVFYGVIPVVRSLPGAGNYSFRVGDGSTVAASRTVSAEHLQRVLIADANQ
jgi:hypothetical protein